MSRINSPLWSPHSRTTLVTLLLLATRCCRSRSSQTSRATTWSWTTDTPSVPLATPSCTRWVTCLVRPNATLPERGDLTRVKQVCCTPSRTPNCATIVLKMSTVLTSTSWAICAVILNPSRSHLIATLCQRVSPLQCHSNHSCSHLHLIAATDCQGTQYGPINTLPQDNYMAYTPDTCQNKFTKQQVSRMRCYLTTMSHLSNAVIDFVAPPFSLKKVSSATQIGVGVSAVATAAMILF